MCYTKRARKTRKTTVKSTVPLQAALAILQNSGQLKQVGGKFYLPVNEDVIRDIAKAFIQKQGFVTTLQIKEDLRKQGYFVKQADVSEEMTSMADDGDVMVTNVTNPRSGREHRLFFDHSVPEPIAVAAFMATV